MTLRQTWLGNALAGCCLMAAAASLTACSDDPVGPASCVPGEVTACKCEAGGSGSTTCGSSGVVSRCDCGNGLEPALGATSGGGSGRTSVVVGVNNGLAPGGEFGAPASSAEVASCDVSCDGVCTDSAVCVGCFGSTDCGGGDPICDTSRARCVECQGSIDCAGNEVCDLADGECVTGCSGDASCGGDRPYCDRGLGHCVECVGDGNCTDGDQRFCDLSVGECVECLGDADCGGTQRCDGARGRCIECLDSSDCGGGEPVCDPVRGRCVECILDSHCGGDTPACDRDDHQCEECTLDSHCAPGESCDRGDWECRGG
ncbi:MAG: hypothetical protein OEZ06_16645 [Myxococcales bacterium]|nr:hypothetical protein [Myxococcales bacterium]